MNYLSLKRLIFATISLASVTLTVPFTSTSRKPHCRTRSPQSVYTSPTARHPAWNPLSHSGRLQQQCRLQWGVLLSSKSNPNRPGVSKDATQKSPMRTKRNSRLTVASRWFRRAVLSLSFASAVAFARPSISLATSAAVISAKQKSAISIRPGMSQPQVDALEHGDVSVMEKLEQTPSIFQTSTPEVFEKISSKAYDDYGDLGDEDDSLSLLIRDDDFASSSKPARQEDKATGELLRASTSERFAAYHQKKTMGLTVKVGLAFFGPTYGFMIGREYVRRRREEAYVKKGLEILEAQKAEYFNITGTSNDADVEDALKGLKNKNMTNADDEDDGDDEDDEEPEPPSSPRRTPRKPLGDPPTSGDDNGGGITGKTGPSKPSAADIDKLNKLLGKS